jgi:hypothetical protein
MNRTEAEPEIEFEETDNEIRAKGLRRIKRRHRTEPDEVKLENCGVIAEIRIDADLYKLLESESEKSEEATIESVLNEILREKFEKAESGKLLDIRELRSKLLNDNEFLKELKEKLAA